MNNPKDPLLLDHEADGIQELDNDLPLWWVWLFYLTIVFAVAYLGYYHVFAKGELPLAEYDREMKAGNAIKLAALDQFETGLANVAPAKDTAIRSRGQELFITYCSPCHRADGGGLVGPNLCDDYWINGSNFVDNVKIIWNGVPAKGMLAWKEQGMKPSDVMAVASHIYTLRGTTPPNPKPREDQTPVPTGPNEFE